MGGRNACGDALMAELGSALRQSRERIGVSKSELARRLGVSNPTIVKRESGQSDLPGAAIQQVARETGCIIMATPNGWQVLDAPPAIPANPDRDEPLRLGPRIPIAGQGGAGLGRLNEDVITEFWSPGDSWFRQLDALVRVVGDSMSPLLRDGDYVGVRLGDDYRRGDVVVAEIGPEHEAVVKVYAGGDEDEAIVFLNSANPLHEHLVLPADDARIVGVALGAWRPGRLRLK